MRQLLPQPLTVGTFAPFGTVVQPLAPPGTPGASAPAGARAINDGTAWRLDLLADLDLQREGGTPGLAVYSAAARTLPMRLHTLEAGSFAVVERHAQAAQAVDCALCTLSAPVELLPPP